MNLSDDTALTVFGESQTARLLRSSMFYQQLKDMTKMVRIDGHERGGEGGGE